MNKITLSKWVGWEPRTVKYPSLRDINKLYMLLKRKSENAMYMTMVYHRFLSSPKNQEESAINSMLLGLYEYMEDNCLQE